MVAINRLWRVMFVHKCFRGDNRVIGRSMIVGIMIFSIVGGLGCGYGLSREFGLRQLGLQGQCLLRRRRMLI